MNDADREILLIAAEECAEVTQALTKVLRFGLDTKWEGVVNSDHLAMEIGDLFCMVDLMVERGMINRDAVYEASVAKRERLKKWSKVFG